MDGNIHNQSTLLCFFLKKSFEWIGTIEIDWQHLTGMSTSTADCCTRGCQLENFLKIQAGTHTDFSWTAYSNWHLIPDLGHALPYFFKDFAKGIPTSPSLVGATGYGLMMGHALVQSLVSPRNWGWGQKKWLSTSAPCWQPGDGM